MMQLRIIGLVAAALLLPPAPSSRAANVLAGAPARNWVLPRFTPEGYRSMTLKGDEVFPVNSGQIDIVDMNITVFSGDASARVDTILLSPAASFFLRENRASGKGEVRLILIREGVDVIGSDWAYDANQKRVSIQKNVRVVFQAHLGNILK